MDFCLDAKPFNATSMAWCRGGNSKIVDEGKGHIIEEMCKAWPFFSTRVGMLEMVFSKTDTWLSEQYDHNLVKKSFGT